MIKITYFVHGTTTDNIEKIATGWLDGKLSAKGIEQAHALHDTIQDIPFDLVISSDLGRAIESANIDFEGRDIKILHDSRLRECNYGNCNGKSSLLVDYMSHISTPFNDGESMLDVENRMRDFVSYLKENYDNKHIAIVAHRAPQLALDVILKNMSWLDAISHDWRNTKSWKPGWEYIIK